MTTVCLHLRTGRTIRLQSEACVLTTDGWTSPSSISTGTKIATLTRAPRVSRLAPSLSEHEIDVLAVLCAEGNTCSGGTMAFSNLDPIIIQLMQEAGQNLGFDVKRVSAQSHPADHIMTGTLPPRYLPGICDCGCGQTGDVSTKHRLKGHRPRTAGRVLAEQHGLFRVKAKHKSVPEAVMKGNLNVVKRFLSVFWMCDGYISAYGPEITLASEPLIRDLQYLLLRLGILSVVRPVTAKCRDKSFPCWRLALLSASIATFAREIALWGSKHSRLQSMLDVSRNPNLSGPDCTDLLRLEIEQAIRSLPAGSLQAAARQAGWRSMSGARVFTTSGNISPSALRALSKVAPSLAQWEWMVDKNIHWDEVRSVSSDVCRPDSAQRRAGNPETSPLSEARVTAMGILLRITAQA
jgi:hypothetical protein